MNRELKFRAWDNNHQKMKELKGGSHLRDSIPTPQQHLNPVMQFTGAVSQSGCDIYDGDFIQFAGDDDIWQVVWEGCGFSIQGNGVLQTLEPWSDMEVMGNIYEGWSSTVSPTTIRQCSCEHHGHRHAGGP
jgi:YopX protein